MPSSNILLFDANKANMMSDEQYNTNTQRLNGVQSGIASSQLQNKTLYQVSLVAYAIAQIMNQNGLDANDTAAVSAFVANLSGTMLQKVADLASTQEAQVGVVTGKWMSPALVKTAIDTLAAKAQNILSDETKTAYGLGSDATPDDVLAQIAPSVSAVASKGNCQLYYQSYTGNGATSRTFTFPKKPKLVMLGGDGYMVLVVAGSTTAACYATNGAGDEGTARWGSASVTLAFSAAQHLCNRTGRTYMMVAWNAADE